MDLPANTTFGTGNPFTACYRRKVNLVDDRSGGQTRADGVRHGCCSSCIIAMWCTTPRNRSLWIKERILEKKEGCVY